MATTNYASVDEYLAAQPARSRDILERVRATIRKAIPKAEEMVSYQIPTYKLDGVPVIYFAGWKEHLSIYPATQTMLADLRKDLAAYKIAKGTIRFEFAEPVPLRLIARVARYRANEVAMKTRATIERTRADRPKKAAAARGKP
jgi:uncharacterized protein YdhG (YjbR/CyaY superfamily)